MSMGWRKIALLVEVFAEADQTDQTQPDQTRAAKGRVRCTPLLANLRPSPLCAADYPSSGSEP